MRITRSDLENITAAFAFTSCGTSIYIGQQTFSMSP
jgi:hypothetical protein